MSAFAALLSRFKFVRDAALGNSEPILAAVVLWAFERHLDGRRDHALYLGVAAALLRPEVWPFLGLYGLWLWFAEPRLRMRLVVFAALVPALWFLPEWWGSGDPFRAGSRANAPNPGSAAFADTLRSSCSAASARSCRAGRGGDAHRLSACAAVAWIRRRASGRDPGGRGARRFAWFALVAGMTEAGFAGNQRYLIVTTAAVCVLGGLGAARVLQGVELARDARVRHAASGPARSRRPPRCSLAVAISSPYIVAKADNTGRVQGGIEHEA